MIGLCVLVLAIVAGCAPAFFRANPQLQEKVQSIKKVAIMPPGVKVYQLAVGGGTQLMDEETAAARASVATAIAQEVGHDATVVFTPFSAASSGLDARRDPVAARLTAELEDTQALFEAVNASVLLHTYKRDPDQTFPEKLKNFDYSLGPDVQQFAKLAKADALLFTAGVDHISTGGRKALIALGALLCSAGVLSIDPGSAVRCFSSLAGAPGPTILSVAVVDATTGSLLWYNVGSGASLTYPQYAADLVEWVFKDFPLGTRPTRVRPQDPTWRW